MTLKEHLNTAIQESTWLRGDVKDTFKKVSRSAELFINFLTDKGTKRFFDKEINDCEEDFSIEIPMECIKILSGFTAGELENAWEPYSSDAYNLVGNLQGAFSKAWKKDYHHAEIQIEDAEDSRELGSILRGADRIVNNIVRNCNMKDFFFQEQIDYDNVKVLAEQVGQLEILLDEFHEKLMSDFF